MMSNDKSTLAEQKLIERLQDAPQKNLNSPKVEAIHHKILHAFDTTVSSSPVPAKAGKIKLIHKIVASVIAIIVVASVIIGLFMVMTPNKNTDSAATVIPRHTVTSEPMPPSPNPSITATSAQSDASAVVVIEGPVSAVKANIITVFDVDIQIDVSNPILDDIQVGDTLHILGEAILNGDRVIIIAIDIVIQEIESPSIQLPPNCKRTSKGKISCK